MHGAKNNDPRSWTIPYKWEHQLEYGTPYGYPANNGTYLGEAVKKLAEKIKGKKLTWARNRDFFMNNKGRPSTESLDVPDNAYMDGAIADEGIRLMKRMAKNGKPFFLALGFRRPHLPFVAPEKYWKLYDGAKLEPAAFQKRAAGSPDCAYHDSFELRNYSDIPPTGPVPAKKQKELVRGYYACVSYVDAQIGRILDELQTLGLNGNTIVVILGDHGWHLGDHGLWCKQTNFEQATRAPLIISAPKYQKKQISDSVVEFVDVYPTVCRLAGFDPPKKIEGKNLVPILENPKTKVAECAVSQYPRDDKVMGYSLRTKRYRYTIWLPWSKKKGITSATPTAVELYDYDKDPEEKTNLADNPEYKTTATTLREKIQAFLEKGNTPPEKIEE
jgi:arylsulfatase A-like enzyme